MSYSGFKSIPERVPSASILLIRADFPDKVPSIRGSRSISLYIHA